MDLRQIPHRALGPLRPSGRAAEICLSGFSHCVVVGRGEGGEDREPAVSALVSDCCFPSPLWGGVGVGVEMLIVDEGGRARRRACLASRLPSLPSPTRGEGSLLASDIPCAR